MEVEELVKELKVAMTDWCLACVRAEATADVDTQTKSLESAEKHSSAMVAAMARLAELAKRGA